MRHLRLFGQVGLALMVLAGAGSVPAADTAPKKPTLAEVLTKEKFPPDWMEGVRPAWDTNRPWKEARLEIRRLLAFDDQAKVREGVKLTWLYAQKGDIGDGHELPMYLFMSGQYAWAASEYPKFLQKVAGKGAAHAYQCYASCLAHFGEHDQALQVLDNALRDLPPKPWRVNAEANLQNQRGDLLAAMGQTDKAKAAYTEAMRLYPQSDQPYGRHLLPRHVAKVKNKLDLLTMQGLATAKLRDGSYTGKSVGYADGKDMQVTVTVAGGKLTDIKVDHAEKIDLQATTIIPQRIIAAQSLRVDAVTGATVTSQAVVDGAYQALKQAGLK